METEKKLIELIPEFNLIKDKELQNNTLKVWVTAMKEGGWVPEDLIRMPFTLLNINHNANMVEHTRGVVQVALKIAETFNELYVNRLNVNMDYLISGALLHDVGKLVEMMEKDNVFQKSEGGKIVRHPFSGVGLAYGKGIPDEVLHMIAVHSKEGDHGKRTLEAIIINHADFVNFDSLRA